MLHYLLPWMNNVELVDFKPAARRPEDCGSGEDDEDVHEREIMMVNSRRWLRGEGWGSPRATTMVLNNLMFMTAKVRQLMDRLHIFIFGFMRALEMFGFEILNWSNDYFILTVWG